MIDLYACELQIIVQVEVETASPTTIQEINI